MQRNGKEKKGESLIVKEWEGGKGRYIGCRGMEKRKREIFRLWRNGKREREKKDISVGDLCDLMLEVTRRTRNYKTNASLQ